MPKQVIPLFYANIVDYFGWIYGIGKYSDKKVAYLQKSAIVMPVANKVPVRFMFTQADDAAQRLNTFATQVAATWQTVVTEVSRYAAQDSVGCFVAGTLIQIDNDAKIIPIQNVKVGDRVLSKPEDGTGEATYKPVTQTFMHQDKPIWLVITKKCAEMFNKDGNVIDLDGHDRASRNIKFLVTPNHPIWVVGTTDNNKDVKFYDQPHWKRVDELQRYEVAVNQDGVMYSIERAQPLYQFKAAEDAEVNPDLYWYQKHYYEDYETDYVYNDAVRPDEEVTEVDYKGMGYVYDVSHYEKEGLQGVYIDECMNVLKDVEGDYIPYTRDVCNLEVADNHTYYIGITGLWVHNTSSPAQLLLHKPLETLRVA